MLNLSKAKKGERTYLWLRPLFSFRLDTQFICVHFTTQIPIHPLKASK